MSRLPSRCREFEHHTLRGVRKNLDEDIRRYQNKSPENQAAGDTFRTRLGAFLTPQIQCLLLYRIAHWLHVNGRRGTAAAVSHLNTVCHKATITATSCIGPACFLPHPPGVTFHGVAGRGLTFYSIAICCPLETDWGNTLDRGPVLGDQVSVAGHSVVIGPVTVGNDTKIAYQIRLDRDAPEKVLVVSRAQFVKIPGQQGAR